jgi:acetylglutamate kinase
VTDSRPLVVKLGGAALDDLAARRELWQSLAECHTILRGHLVVVHGGGRAVDAQLAALGMPSSRRDGIRITPPEQIEQIAGVLAGRINKSLVAAVQACGTRAVGLCLGDGAAVRTTRAAGLNFDPGCVGEVTGGDGTLLRLLLAEGFLPVVCSIGFDERGQLLNVNADEAAAGIARLLHARALALLTDVPGVLDAVGRRLDSVTTDDVETLIASGVISGGMIPKVRAAIAAAGTAAAPAIIASFNVPQDLIALARGEGVGTLITGPERRSTAAAPHR